MICISVVVLVTNNLHSGSDLLSEEDLLGFLPAAAGQDYLKMLP